MIEFEKLCFKQAVTYGQALTTIPLKDQGAVFIGGANGSGKSLSFNVLYNVLFGYTPLATKGKRKLIANKDYYARVEFNINGISFSIEQYFNNKSMGGDGYNIFKNGESLDIAGGIPEQEKYIARLLPFTPEEFSGFYYLSQDALHVLAYGKGSERLNYLSKVFGFNIYDKIRTEIKVKLDRADLLLAEAVRAQDEIEKLDVKLSKYPNVELLDRRIALYTKYLNLSTIEKIKLEREKCKINNDLVSVENREKLELALKEFLHLRSSQEVNTLLKDLREEKRILDKVVQNWKVKKELLEKYNPLRNYIEQDVEYLGQKLDELLQDKGKASGLNLEFTRREALTLDVEKLSKKLMYEEDELIPLDTKNQKKLIETRAALKKLNKELKEFTGLALDEGKCSRCGHLLDAKHIKAEIETLRIEIKEAQKIEKECINQLDKYNIQISILNKIRDAKKLLGSITYKGDRIDIIRIGNKIQKIKDILAKAKEAQRLKKEILKYSVKKNDYTNAIEQIKKIEESLARLSNEYSKSLKKETLESQLRKLPRTQISRQELLTDLQKLQIRFAVLDEVIPIITSDIKGAETIKEVVQDYMDQQKIYAQDAAQIEYLHIQRRILSACWKAYAPAKLKKDAVTKIAALISQKLNVFVPLIFNEDIQFTTDPSENSVDILFKRGNQPPRDVRFLNGGHKKRFLIALIPTLACLISAKKRTNLIILDEIDANIDFLGKEAIGEFLIPYLKEKFKTIIVISPSHFSGGQLVAPIPLDYFDKIWIAEYRDGVSHLKK